MRAPKQFVEIVNSLEEQGCIVKPTKNGWRVLCPDGVTTLGIHRGGSDMRGLNNLQASIRRAGLTYPGQKK